MKTSDITDAMICGIVAEQLDVPRERRQSVFHVLLARYGAPEKVAQRAVARALRHQLIDYHDRLDWPFLLPAGWIVAYTAPADCNDAARYIGIPCALNDTV